MGPGRDEVKSDTSQDWKDKTVCKPFLVGFCPFDRAVLGGKRTLQACEKIHSEVIRDRFNAHDDGKPDSELRIKYEGYAIRDLEFACLECDGHSRKEIERLRTEPRSKALPPDANMRISGMKREAAQLLSRSEKLEDTEARQKETLKKQSEDLMEEAKLAEKEEERKVIENFRPKTCEICGTPYLDQSEYDTHLGYKVHDSYKLVREKLTELKEKKAEREKKAQEAKEAKRKEKNGDSKKDKDDKKDSEGRDRSRRGDRKKSASRDRGRRDRDRERGRKDRKSRSRSRRRR